MLKVTTTALLLCATAAPAMAQNMTPPSPAFSGAHVEALGGWDRPHTNGTHDDGFLYGVGAGYDLRRGNIVFGVEGEASDSTTRERFGTITVHAARDLYAGGRVGVVAGNNLFYAKAGYTNARLAVSGGFTGGVARANLDGGRVGVGVEHALGSRAFVKAEYRYSNYEAEASRNQVVAGIGLRF